MASLRGPKGRTFGFFVVPGPEGAVMQVTEMGGVDHRAQTEALCRRLFSDGRLIIASNRGPAEYEYIDGRMSARRGSGGVVTALSSISTYTGVTWIASPMGDGDRRVALSSDAERMLTPFAKQDLRIRFVLMPSGAYERHYNVFCNPLIWFTQHYLWDLSRSFEFDAKFADSWRNGYVPVNRAFAETIAAEASRAGTKPVVMIHDYHLYLAAKWVRARVPDAVLQHFVHIPWPDPAYWRLLPRNMRTAICESLCANDIVGMQTRHDVVNFLHSCQSFMDGAVVDYQRGSVTFAGRTTMVRSYPISIDVAGLKNALFSPEVRRYREKLRPLLGEKTIVRVDRLDPSKNIIRGFKAYEIFLRNHPQFLGRVKFLAFLVPSRTDIPEYREYARSVKSLIKSINEEFGTDSWRPIELFYENNYLQAIAAMTSYDVLLVNSVMDGMNLVAKEGPMVNGRDGVLLLSEGAGAYEQLKSGSLSVEATDINSTAEAIHQGLTMPEPEKRAKIAILRRAIEREDLSVWLYSQLKDLEPLVERRLVPIRQAAAFWSADIPM